MKYGQRYANRTAHIGQIEDAGAEAPDAEIHEVNHATIMHDAIPKGCPTQR